MNDGEYDLLVRRSRTDAPDMTRRLAVVLRFRDVFTHATVLVPLRVTIPELDWQAYRSASDATYRFSVIGELPPARNYAVVVEAPGGQYMTQGTVSVRIPRLGLEHPPPARAADYLVDVDLWPTPALRLGPGQTAVLGHVQDAAEKPLADHRVCLFVPDDPGAPTTIPAGTPWAPTNIHGDFLYRLPGLGRSPGGLITSAPVDVQVAAQDSAGAKVPLVPFPPGGEEHKLTVSVGSVNSAVTFSAV